MMPDAVVTLWHFSMLARPEESAPPGRFHAIVPGTIEAIAMKHFRTAARVAGDPFITQHGAWVVDGVRYHCRPRVDRIITWWEA